MNECLPVPAGFVMSISIKSILKDSSKFTAVGLLSKAISIPVSIVVAMVLSPKDYGIIAFAALFMSYAGFATFGAMSVAFREMPGLIDSGKFERAEYVQNLGMTIETILCVIVTLILLGIASVQKDSVIKLVMILTTIGWVLGRVQGFLEMINFAFKEFSLSAKGRLIKVILYPVLTLPILFCLKIYTIPIVSMIGAIIIILYFIRSKSYGIRFAFDLKEGMRLIKIGVVLHAGTILYTLFSHTLDRTLIAAYLSKEELGLYIFSYTFAVLFLEIFRDYGRVLKPKIWGYASNASSVQEGFFATKRMAIYFALISCFLIGYLQLGFYFMVNFVTVKFEAAQWVFSIIILYIFWEAIEKFPEMILCSSVVDKQNVVMYIWGICLVVNLVLDIFAIKLGCGITGVAAATTISQAISSISMYSMCWGRLFSEKKEFRRFFCKIILPFLIPIVITSLHWIFLTKVNLLLLIPLSIAVQIGIWIIFVRFFYNDYFNSKMIIDLAKKIRSYLVTSLRMCMSFV